METINKKRSSKRLPFSHKVKILRNSGENISANSYNISQDGILIRTSQDIPVGTNILIATKIGSKSYELDGNIEWSSKNPGDNNYKMGVKLLKITKDFNELYQNVCRKFNVPITDTKTEEDDINIFHKL